MKTITQDYKTNIKKLGRRLDDKLYYTNDGTMISNQTINSITPHFEGNLLKSTMKQLDLDCNNPIPLGTMLTYEVGVKVGDTYEYVNYGNYIVYEVEKQEEINSYRIVCYDKMLYAMKEYESLNITYPISVRDYIKALCDKIGLEFKNKMDYFTNYDQIIQQELYLDNEGKTLGYTYRDVLDELAQVTASTICINEQTDELEIRYPKNTGDYTTVEGSVLTLANVEDERDIELQLQGNTSQNGTPTPDVPVPINVVSGGQNIEVRGSRNICLTDFNEWESGQYDATGKRTDSTRRIRIKKLLAVNPSTTYYFNTNYNPYKFVLRTYDNLGNFVRSIGAINNETTITTNATEYYFGIIMYNSQSEASASYEVFKQLFEDGSIKPFICLNSETDKSYVPYDGKTYEINLGKNLFDKDNANILNMHIGSSTFANNSNARLIYIEIQPNTTYTVSKMLSSRFYVATSTAIPTNGGAFTTSVALNTATQLTITSGGNDKYLSVYFYHTTYDTEITVEEVLATMQIERGMFATNYVPYKIPIELCKIDTYQDGIKKASGKNLFDKTNTTTGRLDTLGAIYYDANYFTSTFIKVLPNTKYVKNSPTAAAYHRVCFYSSASEGDFISRSQDNTFTTPSNCEYLRFCGLQTELNTTMLEEGETVTSYEPYGTGWYIEKQIGKYVYNNDLVSNGIGTGYVNMITPILNVQPSANISAFCNMMLANVEGYTKINGTTSQNRIRVNLASTYATTYDEAKSLYAQNNLTIYYPLANPTYTFIEDEELINQLENVRLLEGLNNIIVSSGDLSSPIKLKYIAEIETLDEENLKNVNVSFADKPRIINSVVLVGQTEDDRQQIQDEDSIEQNGLYEVVIKENQILGSIDGTDHLNEIFKKLNGLKYYINDFQSTGVTYLELCDMYNTTVRGKKYKCIMLNDETIRTTGLTENIYTEELEQFVKEYTKSKKQNIRENRTRIMIDENNQEIMIEVAKKVNETDYTKAQIVAKINDNTSQAKINADEVNLQANDVLNILSGNTINLTGKNIQIASTNFNVDAEGNATMASATLTNGILKIGTKEVFNTNGVLTNLIFPCENWGWNFDNVYSGQGGNFIGFNYTYGTSGNPITTQSFLNFTLPIPDNFVPVQTYIVLRHTPTTWYNPQGNLSQAGSCKNLRAYITTDLANVAAGQYLSAYRIGGGSPTFTLISEVSSHSFSDSQFEEYITSTSENFASRLTGGNTYNISVKTTTSKPSGVTMDNAYQVLGQHTGVLNGYIQVIGYYKI